MKMRIILTRILMIIFYILLLPAVAAKPCSPGSWGDNSNGVHLCTPCASGHYCSPNTSLGNATLSKACPSGTFLPYIGASSISECSTCDLGTYAEGEGHIKCDQCPHGTYCDNTGLANPKFCAPGTYQLEIGATSVLACRPCPEGYACINPAQTPILITADNVPGPADDQDLPTSTGTLTSVPGNNFVTTIINLMRSVTITTSYNATTTSSQTLSTTVTTTRNSLTTTTTTNPTTSTVALVTSSTTATVISSTTIFTMNSSTSSSQTSATITTTITITTTSSSSTATVTTMSRSLTTTTTTQAVTPSATTSENLLTTATSIIMTTISNSLATATQSFTTSTTAAVISLTITSVTMDPTAYTSQTSPTVTSTIATATPMTNENLSTIITNTISQTSSAMIITTANTTETSSPTMTSITTATTTRPLITNYYVQFSFPLNVPNDTSNDTQLVDQLMSVFNRALNVPSNQINITITNRVLRNSRPVTVQVRFFSTAAESADNLLTRTRAQLDNSSSEFRRDNLTAQLNSSSIENIKQYYICSNGAVQESPCTADEIFKTGSALTTVLLASIIPSIFGVIILAIMGFMITRYIRRPSLKPRTSRFDRF